MKICIINNLYRPFFRGGAERITEVISGGLERRDHNVVIITTRPLFKKQDGEQAKQKIYYINSLYYNLSKLPKFLRLFWHILDLFDLGGYYKLRSILRKENPQVVITNNLKGIGNLGAKAIRSLKIRHIHILHDIQLIHPSGLMYYNSEKVINSFSAKIFQHFSRLFFKSPDIVISPSQWLLDLHIKKNFFLGSKKIVIPNPIDNRQEFFNIQKNGIFKFLYVGLIEDHKGGLILVKAFLKLNENNCKLIIIGNGSKIEKIKEIVKTNKKIEILGWMDNKFVERAMAESDCLVVPSLCYENSPTVIYEAFRAGLPVIGSNFGGIAELLSGGSGILFKPNNEVDLAEKMEWALSHKDELGEISKISAKKISEYSADLYMDRLENIFSGLLNDKR